MRFRAVSHRTVKSGGTRGGLNHGNRVVYPERNCKLLNFKLDRTEP